jgi:hypothetical protein
MIKAALACCHLALQGHYPKAKLPKNLQIVNKTKVDLAILL